MVHALRKIHSLLKPNGVLLDMRPALQHRGVGIRQEGRPVELGHFRELMDDDRAANRALQQVLRERLFRRTRQLKFQVYRYADTFEEFEDWYQEFVRDKPCKPSPRLVARVKSALLGQPKGTPIVINGPVIMNVLMKLP
jgi:hypothetical protein